MTPLNIKELYEDRFKVMLDTVAFAEPGGTKDPWLYIIPCKHGHIYPYSDKKLAWYCEGNVVRGNFKSKYPQIKCAQWAEVDEAVFLFYPTQFGLVAEFAKPRKRRRLSEEHKRKLSESNFSHRFRPKGGASNVFETKLKQPNGE